MARVWTGLAAGALTALAACAPQDVSISQTSPQDVPVRRAAFDANPTVLHAVFQRACSDPGDEYSEPDGRTARCDSLPTAEGAAFLLLLFDAELEVPKLVMQKTTKPDADAGFVVELSYYAEITAKSGGRQRIYVPRKDMDRLLDQILAMSGGTPLS